MARDKVDVAKRWLMPTTAVIPMACSPRLRVVPGYGQGPRWGRLPWTRRRRTVRRRHPRKLGGAPNVAEEFRDLGDRVLVLDRMKGRGKSSGAPIDQAYAGIFDFRGDRIWRSRVYFDRAEGLRAAGLSE
jgi:ketosteroid isomerase-like protein